MKHFLEDLQYSKEAIFHPFDAFYEIKYRGKGNLLVATLFFILLGITAVVSAQFSGFLVNSVKPNELNSIVFFSGILLPYMLFIIGNYSITTLMDGKGTLSEIYIVVGYSLLPSIILTLAAVIFSNFITADEIEFYILFLAAGNAITLFLIFIGLIVTHEYTFFRNIISIVLSFFAIALLVFIMLLMITLFSQVYGFVKIVLIELRN